MDTGHTVTNHSATRVLIITAKYCANLEDSSSAIEYRKCLLAVKGMWLPAVCHRKGNDKPTVPLSVEPEQAGSTVAVGLWQRLVLDFYCSTVYLGIFSEVRAEGFRPASLEPTPYLHSLPSLVSSVRKFVSLVCLTYQLDNPLKLGGVRFKGLPIAGALILYL